MTAVSQIKISPARRAAYAVMRAVERGAYASDTLRDRTRDLDNRDARLASEIVFGCLRYRSQLDYLIHLFSGREPGQLDEAALLILRMGIFQLRYLERIPTHAVVSDSVELMKRQKRAAAGFVNAVLRKINRNPVTWPDDQTELSCPAWLLERWGEHFGSAAARRIADAALKEPEKYIRIKPGSRPPDEVEVAATAVEGCFRLLSPLKSGMRLHDISSQAILPLLELRGGQSYLDLCAAPGNKTLQALETPLSLAIACDISFRRISDVPAICSRVVLDASRPLPFKRKFDRIFIDAPCSGTGTLARNPEIKWRVQPQDFGRFREKQEQIVSSALANLSRGGKLLYATCSLEREENEDVIRAVLAREPGVRCATEMWRLPGHDEGDGFYAAVLAWAGD